MHQFFTGSIFPVHPYRREGHSVKGIVFAGGVDCHITEDEQVADRGHDVEAVIADDIDCKAGWAGKAHRVRLLPRLTGAEQWRAIRHFDDIRHMAGGAGIENCDGRLAVSHDIEHAAEEVPGV